MSVENLGGKFSVDGLKYRLLNTHGYASDKQTGFRNRINHCSDWFDAFSGLRGLSGPYTGNLRFSASRVSRNHRNYHRSLPFFREQEVDRARQPHLEILGVQSQEGRIRISIINSGGSVAKGCYGRITIDCKREDVLDPLLHGISAFITPQEYAPIEGANVCWAFAGNPYSKNISVGSVPEALDVVWLQEQTVGNRVLLGNPSPNTISIEPSRLAPNFFHIPSEAGWGVPNSRRMSRVLLRPRTYTGKLLVGGEDVKPIVRAFVLGYIEHPSQVYFELRVDSGTS